MGFKNFILLFIFFLPACEFPFTENISSEYIFKVYPELSLEPDNVKIVLVNTDMDTAVFTYSTFKAINSETIDEILKPSTWKHIKKENNNVFIYRRVNSPDKKMKNWFSLEILKIYACTEKLIIAGMQADYKTRVELDQNIELGDEWYVNNFWVKVEDIVENQCLVNA